MSEMPDHGDPKKTRRLSPPRGPRQPPGTSLIMTGVGHPSAPPHRP